MSMLGMEREKIHACRNDCVLYSKEYAGLEQCPKCNELRYKLKKDPFDDDDDGSNTGIPEKAMWYLLIVPRFKRLFANVTEAERLRWHYDVKISDRKLRHPSDSPQWKKIDSMFETRNLRLGLCTDGVIPYRSFKKKNILFGQFFWSFTICLLICA